MKLRNRAGAVLQNALNQSVEIFVLSIPNQKTFIEAIPKFFREILMRREIILGIFLLSLLVPSAIAMDLSAPAKDLTYITEQFPPFNFQQEGKLQGISVDLLEKMLQHMNMSLNISEIKLLPWDQGYRMALQENNTVIFSTGRIPEREPLFKWVGPISPIKTVLFAMKERHIKIDSPEDLRAIKIGIVRDSAEGPLVVKAGANSSNLVERNSTDELIDMLRAGTIDAWAYPDLIGIRLLEEAGLTAEEYEIVYQLGTETPLYYAFNKNTLDSTVQAFQQALDLTKKGKGADGISDFEKVIYRYLPVIYGRSNVTPQQVMDLVNKTSADVERDAEGVFANISADVHPYNDNPEVVFFVLDTEAKVMAHSSRPSLVGSNEMNRADVSGKRFIEAMITGALRNEQGHEDYIYSSPDRTGLYYKTAYYKLTRGSDGREYIVGCFDYKEAGRES